MSEHKIINKYLNYCVLGIGQSGKSVINFLHKSGIKNIFASETSTTFEIKNLLKNLKNEKIITDFEIGEHSDKVLDCDVIIASPGINTNLKIFKKIKEKNIDLISELEFGYRALNTKNIIAVSGTNGKTTTVNILHEILKMYNKESFLCGNVGTPITEIVNNTNENSFVVIEASSYQLELIKNFHPTKAGLTNITPDHLYRYGSIEKYAEIKFKIFENQNKNDISVINIDDKFCEKISKVLNLKQKITLKTFSLTDKKADIFYDLKDKTINYPILNWKFDTKKLKIFGLHNVQNIMLSILLLKEIIETDNCKKLEKLLENFIGIEHRLEFVAEIDGAKYINDSKSTNFDSTKIAIRAFDNYGKNIILILGGQHKGFSFEGLSSLIDKNVKSLVLFGEAKERLTDELKNFKNIIIIENDLENSLKAIKKIVKKNDIILFSPGCASFDQFKNFEHRGEHFKKLVLNT
ncbi:MAG: UDP-N-acetylmuramoyl-L-alanine--D-glutamate ligase [Elusimicrobiota bacterium]|nr:UDP-N-acetylmuramoyl-L-alanine--D-glutamate ligase [Elusimicrobiota bacterium]